MEDNEVAGKLWEIANFTTAFSVAQSLATTFAIFKGDLDKWLVDWTAHTRALGGTIFFTVAYLVAVNYCGYKGRLLDGNHVGIWTALTVGRSFTIALFGAVLCIVIVGHWDVFNSHRRKEARDIP